MHRFLMSILNTLPERGEYYRIGACPYLLGITIFCPCKGRRVQYHNELCAPYRGKITGTPKHRGKPLRYTMSSLRDLPFAKDLLDTNIFQMLKKWFCFAVVVQLSIFALDINQLLQFRCRRSGSKACFNRVSVCCESVLYNNVNGVRLRCKL